MSCLLELVIGLGPAESSLILLFPVRGAFYSGAAEMSVSISQRCVDLSEPMAVGPPEIPPSPWFRSLTVDLTKVTIPQHLQATCSLRAHPLARNLRRYWGSRVGISPTYCGYLGEVPVPTQNACLVNLSTQTPVRWSPYECTWNALKIWVICHSRSRAWLPLYTFESLSLKPFSFL